jgi:hypothetical protein
MGASGQEHNWPVKLPAYSPGCFLFLFRHLGRFPQLLLRLRPVVGVKTFRLTLLLPNLIGTVADLLRFVR